jgi:hypothetical protein
MPKSTRAATGWGHLMARAQTTALRIMETPAFPPVQASLSAAHAEYRGLQLELVNSQHQRVQRAEIKGFQFQAVHRGLLNGRVLRERKSQTVGEEGTAP